MYDLCRFQKSSSGNIKATERKKNNIIIFIRIVNRFLLEETVKRDEMTWI